MEELEIMYSFEELKKVYNGKKVLMTGHTGFKGAYASVLLKFLGAKVYGYALKEEKDSIYDLLKKEINNVAKNNVKGKNNVDKINTCYKNFNGSIVTDECYGDIRDFKKLKSYVSKIKPDFILHMVAQPLVLRSYDEPLYTYEVNVMGTANLMQAINEVYCIGNNERTFKNTAKMLPKSSKILSVLNVTTDKVYENNDLSNYAFKENDKLCGRDPYANSKSCSELVTYSFEKSYFSDKENIRISTARAGNVIGGGDMSKNRIIPDCFRAIKNNKTMEVRNPSSVRPYQFVLEPIIMYLNIMAYQYKDKKYAGNYNIGPDKKDCLNTKLLVEKFFSALGDKIPKIKYGKIKNARHEAAFLRLDNALIKKVFKYKKIFSIKEMMQYTADTYKLILHKKNIMPYLHNILRKQ